MLTGKESDLKFDSPTCKNCTAKAVSEFTVEYDESVAYFVSNQECIGVLDTLRFDENLGGQINVEVEPLKDVLLQYRDYQSVFNGQYSDEVPPHRSFDHAIDMVEGKEPPWGPIYALSEKELEVLRTYLDDMLQAVAARSAQANLRRVLQYCLSQRKRDEVCACVWIIGV